MIINVRGTNGSGKTTLVKSFLRRYPYIEMFGLRGPRYPEAYKIRVPGRWLFLVGPYSSLTGGIDALSGLGAERTVELLEKYRVQGNVLFEGVIISTYVGAVGNWLVEHKDETVIAFMDTPLDVCLKGLAERGSGHRGTTNVEAKWKTMLKVRKTFDALGVRTAFVSRENGHDRIKGWLTK